MYERFATEEYVLNNGGVLCPQPNCGAGILVDDDCDKVSCTNGCGVILFKRIFISKRFLSKLFSNF